MMMNRTKQPMERPLRKHQQGTVILFCAVGMIALIALAALATDVGHVWAARTQLQAAIKRRLGLRWSHGNCDDLCLLMNGM